MIKMATDKMEHCSEEFEKVEQSDINKMAFVGEIYDAVKHLKEFTVAKCTFGDDPHLLIEHERLYLHPPFGPTLRCRITINACEYVVHILMREVERGRVENSTVVLNLCEKYSSTSKMFKFCPGLDPSQYEQYKEVIRFDPKSVRKMVDPSH